MAGDGNILDDSDIVDDNNSTDNDETMDDAMLSYSVLMCLNMLS